MDPFPTASWADACMAIWLASVAVADWRCRRISNRRILTGGAIAAAALLLDLRPAGILPLDAVGAGALAFCFLMPSYLLRTMGAADVKFGAVLGLWFGMAPLPVLWIAASLLAAGHALCCLVARPDAPAGAGLTKRRIPFGAYMAVAALAALAAGR